MPWKETCVMDEKTAFIAECLRGELPMTALCERYGNLPRSAPPELVRGRRATRGCLLWTTWTSPRACRAAKGLLTSIEQTEKTVNHVSGLSCQVSDDNLRVCRQKGLGASARRVDDK